MNRFICDGEDDPVIHADVACVVHYGTFLALRSRRPLSRAAGDLLRVLCGRSLRRRHQQVHGDPSNTRSPLSQRPTVADAFLFEIAPHRQMTNTCRSLCHRRINTGCCTFHTSCTPALVTLLRPPRAPVNNDDLGCGSAKILQPNSAFCQTDYFTNARDEVDTDVLLTVRTFCDWLWPSLSRSVYLTFGRRTFPVLRSTYSQAKRPPTRPTQLFILSGSINE